MTTTEIRSYRRVFDLERRIYRIDRLRLNPAGVPLRGLVYFLALLAATLMAGRLPLLGLLVGALPWYLRDIAMPCGAAALLTMVRVEGRPAHRAGITLLRYSLAPHELAGLRPRVRADRRWLPDELVLLVDGSDSCLRRLRYRGPGSILVCVAHVRSARNRRPRRWFVGAPSVTLGPLPEKPAPEPSQVIALARGARLEVRR
jgi:hypothetical protein